MMKLIEKIRSGFSAKLTASLTVLCIILLLCFGTGRYFVSYTEADKAVTAAVNSKAESAGEMCTEYMDSFFSAVEVAASNPASAQWMDGGDSRGAEDLCLNIANSFDDLEGVWLISDSSGEVVSSSGERSTVKLHSQSWYSNMTVNSKVQQVFLLNKGMICENSCAVIISAVLDGDRILGFAGAELPLDTLAAFFESMRFEGDPRFVVTDCDGGLIYSSASEGVSGDDIRVSTYYQQATHWTITAAVDEREFTESIMKDFRTEIILLAALMIMLIIVILNIVRYECRRIPDISRSIEEIAAGNYNFRINDSTVDEIGIIARSVDDLASALQEKNALIDEYNNTDILTGAKNRVKMYEAAEDLIAGRDEKQPRFALLFLDIDNFRWINETLGHRYGDIVLKEFSDRVKAVFGRVYRFSSDIFITFVELGEDLSPIDEKDEEMTNLLKDPIRVITSSLYIRCSRGAAVYPDDGDNADALLKCAEIALNRSKEKGKDRLSYYSRSRHSRITDRTAIAQLLTCALEKDELYLNYQPIVSTADRSLHGFEVLLRWESEELGFVPPSRFVEVAEETGEIVKIGTWILETSFRFLKQLNEYRKDVILSINVSAVQLRKHDFMTNVRRVLEITHVDPKNVQVEITETTLVDFDQSAEFINEMAELGFGIALDDFGTGYSSLNYLKDFPISCLKVDKSFVDNIASKGSEYQITDSIIDMVHNMGIKTVAEGVETLAQYNSIVDMKCDYIQGFLMSKPMDESSALEFVRMYDEMYKPDNKQLMETEKKLRSENETGIGEQK